MQVFVEGQDNQLEHDYNLDRLDALELTRSNSLQWNEECRGESLLTLIDDGNCVVIKGLKNKIKLDYSEFLQLLIILAAHNTTKIEFRESKLIKKL